MKMALSLVAAKRVGMLAQIAVEISRAGWQLVDQRMATANDPAVYDLNLVLDGPESAADRVLAGLRALDGVVKVEDTTAPAESPKVAAENLEARLQAAFVEVVDAFPRIVAPVQKFATSLEGAGRQQAMSRLGQRLGRREYKRHFALGSPLKLELALRRMLVPALRPFATALVTDASISVPDCPFCVNLNATEPCCDFLGGFMQGFLDANPATPDLRVKELRCKACGQVECGFACTPANR